jgi:hypothetical protein
MPSGEQQDVTATLSELERKLVDLERELASVAGAVPPASLPALPAAGAVRADAPSPAPDVADLRLEIADLVRFRDQLEGAARDLISEYDRLIARLSAASARSGGEEIAPAADE